MISTAGPQGELSASKKGLIAYFLAVFISQIGNNANIAMLPLSLFKYATPAVASIPASLTNLGDALGAGSGGWIISRLSPRVALLLCFIVRTACLLVAAFVILGDVGKSFDTSSPPFQFYLLSIIYNLDAFTRGTIDTIRTTLPLVLGGNSKQILDQLNAKTMVAFELGVMVGPLMTSFLMSFNDRVSYSPCTASLFGH